MLDLEDGVAAAGAFDIERYLQAAWKQMATALGHYHDEAAFHPEQIRSCSRARIRSCSVSLMSNIFPADDLHRLRGLGFSQDNHRILYVGRNSALQKMGYPLIDPEQEDGTRTGGWSLMENLEAIATDSEALIFEGPPSGHQSPAPAFSPPVFSPSPVAGESEPTPFLEGASGPAENKMIPAGGSDTGTRSRDSSRSPRGAARELCLNLSANGM